LGGAVGQGEIASVPNTNAPVPFDEERRRIRLEYDRRDREIPQDRYALTSPAALFADQQRVRAALRAIGREFLPPLQECRILEVGCGSGGWLTDFADWGAKRENLSGIDLSELRVATARARIPGADLRPGDASALPWNDATFDLIVQSTVFTSILDGEMRRAVAAEMARVLRPGGAILWYDFFRNNPRNRNVRAVSAREVRALFPAFSMRAERITLAPPLARWIVPRTWVGALLLEKLTVLNTHLLVVLRNPAQETATHE